MIERVLGWGREHGHLAHILVQVAVQTVLWSSVLLIIGPSNPLTASYLRQDFVILMLGSVMLLMLGLWWPKLPRLPDFLTRPLVWVLALAVLAVSAAGTWLVFADTPLTRDEILANFDAKFIASGQLVGNPPLEWRPYLEALMPQFMLEVPSSAGWLSGYLPGNAALRSLGMLTIGVEWVSPILASVSILLLYGAARRLWPEDRSAAVLAALLCASSAQVLTTAMAPFAMTAHLAFSLLWLWGFLRRTAWGDACAIGAGFIATGLHQLVFHPLFVAPFILHMWLGGERRRAAVYVAAYAVIGLFWVCYWQILFAGAGAGQQGAAAASGFSYLAGRIAGFLAKLTLDAPLTMGANVLRFVAWQNLALIPLAAAAWPAIRKAEGIARPLLAGIVLTIAAMLVLLPWQGLGWGYRYLHGLIGNFCLLAGYGWISVSGDERRRFFVAAATAVSLLIVIPLQLKHARDYAAPRARAFELASKSDADIVMIAPAEDLYDDLVRNDPDLSNRPKFMDARKLTPAQIATLCSRYRIAIFDIRHGILAGLPKTASPEEIERYSVKPRRIGCGEPLPLSR
jgi:hypothetical protein